MTGHRIAKRAAAANDADQGGPGYDRQRDLPRLICCWPTDSLITEPQRHDDLVARLRHALRAERRRGMARHWSYDLVRHRALVVALRSELANGAATTAGRRLAAPSATSISLPKPDHPPAEH